ncbi:hypothetical protein ABW19_dt0204685 [Dactylella cylindrospora]|nr:hypothetical protein ABW19_dt0204685 [Dactylella cylindrospora]
MDGILEPELTEGTSLRKYNMDLGVTYNEYDADTPLHRLLAAAQDGDSETVQDLLEGPNEFSDEDLSQALHNAITWSDDAQTAIILICHGAPIEGRHMERAIQMNDVRVLEIIQAHREEPVSIFKPWYLRRTMGGSETPSGRRDRPFLTKWMLEKGARITQPRDPKYTNVMETAVEHGTADTVKLLLTQGGNPYNGTLYRPLTNRGGDFETEGVVKVLVEYGADINGKSDAYEGASPLHWALEVDKDTVSLVDILVKLGADLDKMDDIGRTPADVALINGLRASHSIIMRAKAERMPERPKSKWKRDFGSRGTRKAVLSLPLSFSRIFEAKSASRR